MNQLLSGDLFETLEKDHMTEINGGEVALSSRNVRELQSGAGRSLHAAFDFFHGVWDGIMS